MPKVIPLKLFLDMVPSSSEDFTRAMHGLPKQFSRKLPDRNVFCTLTELAFCSAGPSFALCSLAVHYFAVYLVLGNLVSKPQR